MAAHPWLTAVPAVTLFVAAVVLAGSVYANETAFLRRMTATQLAVTAERLAAIPPPESGHAEADGGLGGVVRPEAGRAAADAAGRAGFELVVGRSMDDANPRSAARALRQDTTVVVGGERVHLSLSPRRDMVRGVRSIAPGLILLGGIALAGVLTLLLVHARRRDALTVALARALATQEATAGERRRVAARFRNAVELAPSGILIYEESGRVVLANANASQMFGYAQADLVGTSVRSVLPDGPGPDAATDGRLQGGREPDRPGTRARPLAGRRQDGSEFPVEVGVALLPEDGRTLVMASVVDVTERRAYENRLQRSNADLERFAYVASHDLQEPLRTVASYVRLLERRYRGRLDDEADEFIGYAVEGAARMKRLVDDLLTYARVGTIERRPDQVDAEGVAADVLADLAEAITRTEAVVEVGELPVVFADRSQLYQVLLNLVGNALKFHGDARPQVRIRARRARAAWAFSVSDNGIGFDPGYSEQVFEMFRRLHPGGRYEGTGIGLAMCHRIVARHGGRMWVESEEGRGSTFWFTIPYGCPVAPSAGSAPAASVAAKERAAG